MRFLDLHYHAGPDLFERRHNVSEAGQMAKEHGYTLVLKSHLGSTVNSVLSAQQQGLPLLASLVLNSSAGGVDPKSVLAAAKQYRVSEERPLLVYLPTLTGAHTHCHSNQRLASPELHSLLQTSETCLENGRLRSQVLEILRMATDLPIRLATGHSDAQTVFALLEACEKLGVDRLLVTHPAHPCLGWTVDVLKEVSKNSILWFEQTALSLLLGRQTEKDFNEAVVKIPRLIFSSDLGQRHTPDLPEMLSRFVDRFQSLGLSSLEIEERLVHRAEKFLYARRIDG